MNRNRLLALIFLAVALIQLALPASHVCRYEQTLRKGAVFKFRTAPLDPYDAFRGRYVALSFDTQDAAWTEKDTPDRARKIFVQVETGEDGFARLTTASAQRPASGDYLEVQAGYPGNGGSVSVVIPFDRFYMGESLAPEAEKLYRDHSGARSERDAFALVRIREGIGVIEQVFVGEKTLAEAARERLKSAN